MSASMCEHLYTCERELRDFIIIQVPDCPMRTPITQEKHEGYIGVVRSRTNFLIYILHWVDLAYDCVK